MCARPFVLLSMVHKNTPPCVREPAIIMEGAIRTQFKSRSRTPSLVSLLSAWLFDVTPSPRRLRRRPSSHRTYPGNSTSWNVRSCGHHLVSLGSSRWIQKWLTRKLLRPPQVAEARDGSTILWWHDLLNRMRFVTHLGMRHIWLRRCTPHHHVSGFTNSYWLRKRHLLLLPTYP